MTWRGDLSGTPAPPPPGCLTNVEVFSWSVNLGNCWAFCSGSLKDHLDSCSSVLALKMIVGVGVIDKWWIHVLRESGLLLEGMSFFLDIHHTVQASNLPWHG